MIKVKPKSFKAGDILSIDAIIEHPMETGMRKDKDGKLVPAHFITNVKVEYDGKVLSNMDMSQSVSVNPFIGFNLKAVAKSELKISTIDNKGEKSEKSITLEANG
jgi:sulfur-oxidizing protein SoxZ